MLAHALPSVATLEADDDRKLTAELDLARLRAQAAVVRTLSDHVERFARPEDVDGLSKQLLDEVARMGHRLSDAADAMMRSPRPWESGVFLRVEAPD
jgi:hypothetical protein